MRRLLALLMLTLGAGAAHADNGLLSVGAGISREKLGNTATITNTGTNWKLWASVRPIKLFAVEADYYDFGGQSATYTLFGGTTSFHVNYKAYAGYAVGYVPIPLPYLDVFGKLGVARWTQTGSESFLPGGGFISLDNHRTKVAGGVGGQLHIGNLGARLEYENFDLGKLSGVGLFSLSVFFNVL